MSKAKALGPFGPQKIIGSPPQILAGKHAVSNRMYHKSYGY